MLRQFKGSSSDLGRAEQFFLEMLQIPRYAPRLEAIALKTRFGDQLGDIERVLTILVD